MYLEFQAGADSEFAKAVPSFIARKRLQWQRQRTVRDRLRQERILSLDTAVVGATDAFHALSLRLGTNNFFYDKISTLDLTVAAYVTVAAFGYPNQLNPLAAVLTEFYPGLLGHACRTLLALLHYPHISRPIRTHFVYVCIKLTQSHAASPLLF
jgi:hypothetical protein